MFRPRSAAIRNSLPNLTTFSTISIPTRLTYTTRTKFLKKAYESDHFHTITTKNPSFTDFFARRSSPTNSITPQNLELLKTNENDSNLRLSFFDLDECVPTLVLKHQK